MITKEDLIAMGACGEWQARAKEALKIKQRGMVEKWREEDKDATRCQKEIVFEKEIKK